MAEGIRFGDGISEKKEGEREAERRSDTSIQQGREGGWTHIGGNGRSVIDYVMLNGEGMKRVKELSIEKKNTLRS